MDYKEKVELLNEGGYLKNNKSIAKMYGAEASQMLGEIIDKAIYWESNKEKFIAAAYKPFDGEFFILRSWIEEETGLSSYKQRKAENVLKENGFITITPKGRPGEHEKMNWYRVQWDTVKVKLFNVQTSKDLTSRREENARLDVHGFNANNNKVNKNKVNKNKLYYLTGSAQCDKHTETEQLSNIKDKEEYGAFGDSTYILLANYLSFLGLAPDDLDEDDVEVYMNKMTEDMKCGLFIPENEYSDNEYDDEDYDEVVEDEIKRHLPSEADVQDFKREYERVYYKITGKKREIKGRHLENIRETPVAYLDSMYDKMEDWFEWASQHKYGKRTDLSPSVMLEEGMFRAFWDDAEKGVEV